MKKAQVVEQVKTMIATNPKLYAKDKPARRMLWNDYTDCLRKDGLITDHQFRTWVQPF